MKFLKQLFIFSLLSIILLFGSLTNSTALTREAMRSNNHVFTYSIEPSWKSGPIEDAVFDLWFKIFNDDPKPFTLKRIVVDYPKKLRIKRRGYDNKPIIRPRKKMRLDTGQNKVTFTYDEALRGFVEGKLTEKKMINIEHFVRGNHTVTDPIVVQVIWSPLEDTDTEIITIKKDLAINT